MISHLLRLSLGRRVAPFVFRRAPEYPPDLEAPALGIYVHIPFCRTLCPFCPYYKVPYDPDKVNPFTEALLQEIRLAAALKPGREITSVYFGGGTPTLLREDLPRIMAELRKGFTLKGEAGIEVHPRDVTDSLLDELQGLGFTMVSLGIQSFHPDHLQRLGRTDDGNEKALRQTAARTFHAVDADLIFGIPGQQPDDLRRDFRTAVESGATQISTYPFIDFSYANNVHKPVGFWEKRHLLKTLVQAAKENGFERNTVWTFRKKGTPQYSSVTRDNFLGFGPSAASLGREAFKINTFNVDEYVAAVRRGVFPTSLVMQFDQRTRALYWLFWRCYNLDISSRDFRELFGLDLMRYFGGFFLAGHLLGLLRRGDRGMELTETGAFAYHQVEQIYTRQYIDKTWRVSQGEAFPDGIALY